MPPDQSRELGWRRQARRDQDDEESGRNNAVLTFTELVLLWLETWDPEQPNKRQPAADQLRLLEYHTR